jgi:hypothetical protein
MADTSKLKRKSSLGLPPSMEEASQNLQEPETVSAPTPYVRTVDGRTRRRTHRTIQLNLKITPECDTLIREIADQEGLLLAEVLEKALHLYKDRIAAS